MNELVDLMNEYMSIADKDSLYARVLKSVITEREQCVRQELEGQIEATIRDREHRTRMRRFAQTAPLERFLALYAPQRFGCVNDKQTCDAKGEA